MVLSEKPLKYLLSDNMPESTGSLLVGDEPISSQGYEGSGGPWWIWIIVGVLVLLLCACLGYALWNRKRKEKGDEKPCDDATADGLDEPFLLPDSVA